MCSIFCRSVRLPLFLEELACQECGSVAEGVSRLTRFGGRGRRWPESLQPTMVQPEPRARPLPPAKETNTVPASRAPIRLQLPLPGMERKSPAAPPV